MHKKKRITVLIIIGAALVAVGVLGWFLACIFEGEPPHVVVSPLPEFLASSQKLVIQADDRNRGLRRLKISLDQEGRKITILEKEFPFKGILNREGIHTFRTEVLIDPRKLNLAQGRMDLYTRVWDYSRRNGGDGNLTVSHQKISIDTVPPAIRVISRLHYINVGGTGLVIYRVSSDTDQSGVFVNDYYFPGFRATAGEKEGTRVCYFAIPQDMVTQPSVYLWAKDKAGNRSTTAFNYHIRKRKFRTERMNISDDFIEKVLPYFSFYPLDPKAALLEKYLKINNDLRKKNAAFFHDLLKKCSPEKLWEGPWVALKNSAAMARFGDRRQYYYNGKLVDKQVHLGLDLASLAHSDVPASNTGRIVFAGRLGIYGQTVIIDHGQGLASSYSHLSNIAVAVGGTVHKGDTIGQTGQTGLAGGDHLHFGVLVDGVFVNPEEWCDSHWVQDNIDKKLALLQ
jgi:murein DD-endopeptidase MepM/ murein hydrolase activator NlpD